MSVTLGDRLIREAKFLGKVTIKSGIVFVTLPNGDVWSFTVPTKEENNVGHS